MMRLYPLIHRSLPLVGCLAFAMALGVAMSLPHPAAAQSSPEEMQSLLDRVDRLQRDLNTLQRQVYQGSSNGTQNSGSAASGAAAPSGNVATTLELRIQDLEEQMQTLRGQIEEANYHNKTVSDRLDKLSSDLDFRLSAIEKKIGLTPGAADTSQPAAPPGAAQQPAPGQQPATVFIPPETGGDKGAPSSGEAPATAPAPAATLPAGPPKDQYAYAFGLINQNDYAGGEHAFKEFLSQHPDDPLAGNAQYWLGRTYFARNNFNDATRAFAEGYKKYPHSQHAAENLLYLGRSLAGLNQKGNACQAFARLLREYPKATDTTKASVQTERKKLACS